MAIENAKLIPGSTKMFSKEDVLNIICKKCKEAGLTAMNALNYNKLHFEIPVVVSSYSMFDDFIDIDELYSYVVPEVEDIVKRLRQYFSFDAHQEVEVEVEHDLAGRWDDWTIIFKRNRCK